jgi:hypothetical protein
MLIYADWGHCVIDHKPAKELLRNAKPPLKDVFMTEERTAGFDRIHGAAFWFLLFLSLPLLVMWVMVYKGVFYPIWCIFYMSIALYVHYRTTNYVIKIGSLYEGSEIRNYQERPWVILGGIPCVTTYPALGKIMMGPSTPHATAYLSYVAFGILAINAGLEFFRRVRF